MENEERVLIGSELDLTTARGGRAQSVGMTQLTAELQPPVFHDFLCYI